MRGGGRGVRWGSMEHKGEGQWADLEADYAPKQALTPHSICRVQQQQGKPPPLQPPANPQGRAVVHSLWKCIHSNLLLYIVLSINTFTAEAAQHNSKRVSTGESCRLARHVALQSDQVQCSQRTDA